MIGFAIMSGHTITAGSPRRHFAKWPGAGAFCRLYRVALTFLTTAVLASCAVSEERYAPARLSNSDARRVPETGFYVPAIARASIKTDDRRRSVAFETTEDVGTVVVDMAAGSLYLVTGEGRAMRYRIEPLELKGAADGSSRAENWAVGDLQPARGIMIRMKNPGDAEDLHQRMSAGGKVVFLSSSK